MSGKVLVNDRVWRDVLKRCAQLAKGGAKVGIVGKGAAQDHGDATNAEIGAAHEFGTEAVPERSFIRSTFRNKTDQLRRLQQRLIKGILLGKITPDTAYKMLGAWGAGAIKATITRDGNLKPLAPSTLARRKAGTVRDSVGRFVTRKSSKPLVDTGQLLGSITWTVVA